MELIAKVRELVAALRANDWAASVQLTLAIIQMIVSGMSEMPTMPAFNEELTLDEFANELEKDVSRTQGPLLDMLLAKMLALLLKLFTKDVTS